MKIISPFRDYYDYLSDQYGVDNNLIYHRNTEINISKTLGDEKAKLLRSTFNRLFKCFNYVIVVKNIRYVFKVVSILGTVAICVTKVNPDGTSFTRLAKQEDFINIIELSRKYYSRLKKYKDSDVNFIDFNPNVTHSFGGNEGFIQAWANGSTHVKSDYIHNRNGFISDKIGILKDNNNIIMNFHKELGQPVFSFNPFYRAMSDFTVFHYDVDVILDIPNLSTIQGVSGLFSTFEIYQGIVNFLGERKGNSDLNPPVELANNDKIVKAGFDTKTSFRHPINVIRRKK